ncbi:MAG: hypothetical protein LAN70_18655 [Acidobacteriia bacterium]|nr:hypothetical protein [Terriglobia bacterium]
MNVPLARHFVIVAALMSVVSPIDASAQVQTKTPRIHSAEGPRADYVRSGVDAAARTAKDDRMRHFFSNPLADPIATDPTPKTATVSVTVDSAAPKEGLPVSGADVVLIGRVTSSSGFVAPDKTGVYSEFTVTVAEVLKQDGSAPIATGSAIVVTRRGADVYFPSGHVRRIIFAGMGFPKDQTDYVMFLRKSSPTGSDYVLSTAYELTAGSIFALDDGEQFDQYEGANTTTFLANLRSQLSAVPHLALRPTDVLIDRKTDRTDGPLLRLRLRELLLENHFLVHRPLLGCDVAIDGQHFLVG